MLIDAIEEKAMTTSNNYGPQKDAPNGKGSQDSQAAVLKNGSTFRIGTSNYQQSWLKVVDVFHTHGSITAF